MLVLRVSKDLLLSWDHTPNKEREKTSNLCLSTTQNQVPKHLCVRVVTGTVLAQGWLQLWLKTIR